MKNIVLFISITLLIICEAVLGTNNKKSSMLTPEAMKKDFDFILKNIDEIHPNMYAYISKEEFNTLKVETYEKLNKPLNDLEYYIAIAPLVAEIRNGHTRIRPNKKALSILQSEITKAYPIEIDCHRGSVFIKGYYGLLDLPMGEILEINNRNATAYLKQICRYNAVELKNYDLTLVEKGNLAVLMWMDNGQMKPVNLKVKSEQGQIHNLTIDAVEISEIKKVVVSRQSTKATPEHFEFTHDKENDVAIMTIKGFSSRHLEKFKVFLEKHFSYIHEKNINNLIIDIRDNSGGSTNLSWELISCLTDKPFKLFSKILIKLSKQIEGKLPSKVKKEDEGKVVEFMSSDKIPNKSYQVFRGKTYLLINRNTFSTALGLAVVLQYYSLAILVGEETKDTPSGYGEVVILEAPNTKMQLQVSDKYFEALGDKKDGRGVVPDYEVYQKPQDTAKGIDTVLQFTLGLIKESNSKSQEK
jgi:hypothetical protein